MVGWSDYFDLKQAETAALHVATMKKRGRRLGALYFLFARSDAGVSERSSLRLRAEPPDLHADATF